MIYGITLIILSILAVPSLLLSRKPDAKELLDKITPYQGWIGLIFCFWGVWGVISAILNISWLADWPIYWSSWLVGSALEAILGFILGYAMINKLVLSNNPTAQEKGAEMLAKLAPVQGKIGIVGIGFGVWMIVTSILFH